jgi:hypothetical protein
MANYLELTGPLQQDTARLLDKRPHSNLCANPPRIGDASLPESAL